MFFLLILIFCLFAILELFIYLFINYFKKEFQWLITRDDESPKFNELALDNFISSSYDPILGWVRKPNSMGVEKGEKGEIKYFIDSNGSRRIEDNEESIIASFGDSYTFCRQVEDFETWQYFLSKKIHKKVLNFGVGNYGIDQALIRYNQVKLDNSIKIVIMGVVPETICRIHSYWKHYLEFGNTFAFKPRYKIENGKLRLLNNPMSNKNDFSSLKEKLHMIQDSDDFYNTKFKKYQFRFPYLLSFIRNFNRNLILFFYLFRVKIYKFFNIFSEQFDSKAFGFVMKQNIFDSHQMYQQKDKLELFKSILLKFNADSKNNNHKPCLLIIPQLNDLRIISESRASPYKSFFNEMQNYLDVIDLTEDMLNEDYQSMYIDDVYGGHLSKKGNIFVSRQLSKYILDKGLY